MPDHRQKKIARRKTKRAAVVRRDFASEASKQSVEIAQREMLLAMQHAPMGPSYVSSGWQDPAVPRLHTLILTRQLDGDRLAPVILSVDLGCRGVTDARLLVPLVTEEFGKLLEAVAGSYRCDLVRVDGELGTAIAHRAVEHARKFDLHPPAFAQAVLQAFPFDPGTAPGIPVGRRGKPLLTVVAGEDTKPVVKKLVAAVGPDGFEVEVQESRE